MQSFFSMTRKPEMPSGPTQEEYNAGMRMDPVERLRTLQQRCNHWPTWRADHEMRDALEALAIDYGTLRERVERLQETVNSLVGDGRG